MNTLLNLIFTIGILVVCVLLVNGLLNGGL